MLKLRLMGTKNEIKWFAKILERTPKLEVVEFSNLYINKGTDKYYRAYVEVIKTNNK
jgi:Ran GTPase-activating protein (RanGAP) involved in mRNA processing and transport